MKQRRRRFIVVIILLLSAFSGFVYEDIKRNTSESEGLKNQVAILGDNTTVAGTQKATEALDQLEVKGRAPKTGYKRSQFGDGWANAGACDVRNVILKRDMSEVVTRSPLDCTVLTGKLVDPYTANSINFLRGPDTSDDVQIDHVVALSDAWQKGAQALTPEIRLRLANDPVNLLAVDGKTNNDKSDSDAATWLPPNKDYRCRYVARQIAVKKSYQLWVTKAEKDAMSRVLRSCPDQLLPVVQ